MKLDSIHIRGFRNFNDVKIKFSEKTLIIGANDVGKTNLIYALRLLFDKSINEHDLELKDSDYNAYSKTNDICITVKITSIDEECLLSIFKENIKDREMLIRYRNNKKDNYSIYVGHSEETLEEKTSRYYLKRLNMECVDTNRDLFGFLKRERINLLQCAKNNLSQIELDNDEKILSKIQGGLNNINQNINSMNYIATSLENVNTELKKLSINNEDQNIEFVAGNSDAGKLLDNLSLAYSAQGTSLTIGGDGRNNQIFLATWIAKQLIQKSENHVTFYAIEEPEAHLHPHQQRKLSQYIVDFFTSQIFITSHSPQIVANFNPENMIRLYSKNKYTYAAYNDCKFNIKTTIEEFGYRLNVLSAEVFFSNGVFLVEGISEVLFYKKLAAALGIDLDQLNCSILSVEGVGFKKYIKVCEMLNIQWVMRTDNDVFSKPNKKPTQYYYAGVTRVVGICKEINSKSMGNIVETSKRLEQYYEWDYSKTTKKAPSKSKEINDEIRENLKDVNIYLSDVDLETDLAHGPLEGQLKEFYDTTNIATLIKKMQQRKAEHMLEFLNDKNTDLKVLEKDSIADPLYEIKNIITNEVHPKNE